MSDEIYYQDKFLVAKDGCVVPLRMGDYLIESMVDCHKVAAGHDILSYKYTLLGGGPDPNEGLLEAAMREGREEAGMGRKSILVVPECITVLEDLNGRIITVGQVVVGQPYKLRTFWRTFETTGVRPRQQLPRRNDIYPEVLNPQYVTFSSDTDVTAHGLFRPSSLAALRMAFALDILAGVKGATETEPDFNALAHDWEALSIHEDIIQRYCGTKRVKREGRHVALLTETERNLLHNLEMAEMQKHNRLQQFKPCQTHA